MKLLVSIHDVSPATAPRVQQLWARCAARGIWPALLVVPNWHGEWPLDRYPHFVRWLRRRCEQGAEIFLHGERHDESGLRRRWPQALSAWGRTANEAEFLTLNETQARERIERGAALLRSLGLDPVGFVAPAWLAKEGTARAAAACGLVIGEDERYVFLYRRQTRLASPVVRWSARTAFRAHASALVAGLSWLLYRRHPLVRLALHPGDLSHPSTERSLTRSLDRWLATRPVWRYTSLCG
jgi:predicted deacetylase